jgi:hypothetical protein
MEKATTPNRRKKKREKRHTTTQQRETKKTDRTSQAIKIAMNVSFKFSIAHQTL